jgi:NAD(P)-dependent dehydrogenase (short-subunit alcohol dehydrogenase family)
MSSPLCLVAGVGSASGRAVVERFANNGYRVAMLARTLERLEEIEAAIPHSRAFECDVADLASLSKVVDHIRCEMGDPDVLVHNAVSESFVNFDQGDAEQLERNFRVNTSSLLVLAQLLTPAMIAKGHGSIVVTSNTAALRGVPRYALFAPTKAAQRILAQSLARDLGPKRVHVSCVIVDAAIDAAWLSENGRVRPDWLEPPVGWPHDRSEYFAQPASIAEEVFRLAHQAPSAWAFESIIRPFAERW